MTGTNVTIPMSRRYPDLKDKVLRRDAKIVKKIIEAWDQEADAEKVLSLFLKEKENLSSYRYWELLRSVWIICGSVENADTFRKLMKADIKNRHYFSTPEEAEFLRELPKNFFVYRAQDKEDDGGLSWTLSEEYANWYKETYHKKGVWCKIVPKAEVFAYINRNNESEIIIL